MPIAHARSAEFLIRHARQEEAAARRHAELMASITAPPTPETTPTARPPLRPMSTTSSQNRLRPRRLSEVIGQEKLKPLLRRLIDSARASGEPLDHMLLVGASGTGKTTLASVIANEIGTRVFELKAPVDMATLMQLRTQAHDRDIVFVDELHLQCSGDRRGLTQAADPESLYTVLEDGVLQTPDGALRFPRVTWIGATTDLGLLPEPLTNRFTLQPRLAPYSEADMTQIAESSAQRLGLRYEVDVPLIFARASRGVPRQLNSYMKAAQRLTGARPVSTELAREVVEDLFSTTLDGLTESMQIVLKHLYRHCARETKNGIAYSASVNTLATAAGHGRDTKFISLSVEPYLLQRGLLQVLPSGRTLTPAGVVRAHELCRLQ